MRNDNAKTPNCLVYFILTSFIIALRSLLP